MNTGTPDRQPPLDGGMDELPLGPMVQPEGSQVAGEPTPAAVARAGRLRAKTARQAPTPEPRFGTVLPAWFWAMVRETPEGHWTWVGRLNADGYAVMRWRGRRVLVHRFMLVQLGGGIPPGWHGDHVCRVRACIRPHPDHVEAVTPAVNQQRRVAAAKQAAPGQELNRDRHDTPPDQGRLS